MYERACRAPSRCQVDAILRQFGPKQREYISRFNESQLYRSYSSLQDFMSTSQGDESQMRAEIDNIIRGVEPQ